VCGLGNARVRLHAPLPPPRLSSFHLPRHPAPLNELCAFSKSFITSLPNLALRQRWRLMLQHPSRRVSEYAELTGISLVAGSAQASPSDPPETQPSGAQPCAGWGTLGFGYTPRFHHRDCRPSTSPANQPPSMNCARLASRSSPPFPTLHPDPPTRLRPSRCLNRRFSPSRCLMSGSCCLPAATNPFPWARQPCQSCSRSHITITILHDLYRWCKLGRRKSRAASTVTVP